MNSPRFQLNLEFDNLRPKIKLVLGVLLFNSLIILTLATILYFFIESAGVKLTIANLKARNGHYFYTLNLENFLRFLSYYCLQVAVLEESLFRYPILALIKSNLKIQIKHDLTKLILVILMFCLNLIWAVGLKPITLGHPMPVPIFLAGIPLYWLVIKTKCLWPAVLCHALSNFLLYIFVQTLLYFHLL